MVLAAVAFPVAAQAPREPSPAILAPYLVANSVPLVLSEPPRWTFCSCVLWAKGLLGRSDESWGDAGRIKPDPLLKAQNALIGDVLLTTEGGGHVGVIIAVASHSLTISEANYIHCQPSTRTLDMNSQVIRGLKRW